MLCLTVDYYEGCADFEILAFMILLFQGIVLWQHSPFQSSTSTLSKTCAQPLGGLSSQPPH